MNPGDRELTGRLRWLCRLRWLAAAGILVLSLGARYYLGLGLPLRELLPLGATMALYNLILVT